MVSIAFQHLYSQLHEYYTLLSFFLTFFIQSIRYFYIILILISFFFQSIPIVLIVKTNNRVGIIDNLSLMTILFINF